MSAAAVDLTDVDLPEEWNAWPPGARVAYLAETFDREALLALVVHRAGLEDGDLGREGFRKAGLARLAVALDGGERDGE